MKIAIIATIVILMASEAMAASNPQTIAGGFPFPVYVNGTGTNQTNAESVYVNQTQYTPAAGTTAHLLSATGAGK